MKSLFTLFLILYFFTSIAQIGTTSLRRVLNYIQTVECKTILKDSLRIEAERYIKMYKHIAEDSIYFKERQMDAIKVWIENNCFESENFCYVNNNKISFSFPYVFGKNCINIIKLIPYFIKENIIKIGYLLWYGGTDKSGGNETILSFRVNQSSIILIQINQIIIN
ncbi:MAG TPA: hypothetical protein VGP55_08070 [Chitinophagaceae bacterium]|nr:hypothetical protein [Chitinophagaceae bacterium]